MAMTESVSDFFDADEFAVTAIWKTDTQVKVIFDNEYTEQFGTTGTSPIILGAAVDFDGVLRGQSIILNATNYKIKNIEPDGTGMLRLELTKV